MLFADFYTIRHSEETDSKTTFHIRLNPEHFIYRGHFPGQPVLPGVCTLQIIKECAEQLLGENLRCQQMMLCKFLRFVDPAQCNEISLTLSLEEQEGGRFRLVAEGMSGGFYFIKMKGIYQGCSE
jgi:3-hydroxyacyl-[acyl-carrier-protein] dehydratase